MAVSAGPTGKVGKGTYVVKIDVDTTEMEHQKVTQTVDALHRIFVALICGNEPAVVLLEKLEGGFVGPETMLEVGVGNPACFLCLVPIWRQSFVARFSPVVEDLMDDLGNVLGSCLATFGVVVCRFDVDWQESGARMR